MLRRARAGDRQALDQLFARYLPFLRRWASGRLPRWARAVVDTADLVQDALLNTFRRIDVFEPQGRKALQAYLRQAVHNRINDECRRIVRHGSPGALDVDQPSLTPSPVDVTIGREAESRYRAALGRLRPSERELVVGHVELGYSHNQLASMMGLRTPDAARMALRRALVRLAEEMSVE